MDAERTAEEYALTDLGLREQRPIFIERLLRNPALEGNRAGVENMVSSKKENMVESLKMLDRDFGGAEKYVRDRCGLTDGEVQQLKKNLTEAES